MKLLFGDIVVVEGDLIGVVVKTWIESTGKVYYEVYVRSFGLIIKYFEDDVERYQVRHKELDENELEYQNND